jgi:hypothetical protein
MSKTELSDFLNKIQTQLQSDTLDEKDNLLLLQFYTKSTATVPKSEQTEHDPWDYFTLGIYMYEVLCAIDK